MTPPARSSTRLTLPLAAPNDPYAYPYPYRVCCLISHTFATRWFAPLTITRGTSFWSSLVWLLFYHFPSPSLGAAVVPQFTCCLCLFSAYHAQMIIEVPHKNYLSSGCRACSCCHCLFPLVVIQYYSQCSQYPLEHTHTQREIYTIQQAARPDSARPFIVFLFLDILLNLFLVPKTFCNESCFGLCDIFPAHCQIDFITISH